MCDIPRLPEGIEYEIIHVEPTLSDEEIETLKLKWQKMLVGPGERPNKVLHLTPNLAFLQRLWANVVNFYWYVRG